MWRVRVVKPALIWLKREGPTAVPVVISAFSFTVLMVTITHAGRPTMLSCPVDCKAQAALKYNRGSARE